jgi:hypothetical protein
MAARLIALAIVLSCAEATIEGFYDAGDSNCDQTSLIQLKSNVELGSERIPDLVAEAMAKQAQISPADITAEAIKGNDSAIDMASQKAQADVYAASETYAHATSDKKEAQANHYVQKFATEVATMHKKAAQVKADAATSRRYSAARKATKAKNMALEAQLRAKAKEEAFNASTNASLRAQLMAEAAMNQSIVRENALNEAVKMQKLAKFKADAEKTKAYRKMVIADAQDAMANAKSDAETAATARAVSAMADKSAKEAAYWAALNASTAGAAKMNMTNATKILDEAEKKARSAARAYQHTAQGYGVTQLSNGSIDLDSLFTTSKKTEEAAPPPPPPPPAEKAAPPPPPPPPADTSSSAKTETSVAIPIL